MQIEKLKKVHDGLVHIRNRYSTLTGIFKNYHASIKDQLSEAPYQSEGYIVSDYYEDDSFSIIFLSKKITFCFELHKNEQGLCGKVSCFSQNRFKENEISEIDSFTFKGTGETNVTGLADPIFLNSDEYLVNLTFALIAKSFEG